MSDYENVVVGKLKLKGKPLNVKAADGINKKKKKKRNKKNSSHFSQSLTTPISNGEETMVSMDQAEDMKKDDHLTPAERRYLQQWEKIDRQRLAKMAAKSHRVRIQEFNQYLANLSEHYDIPKVGPG
ncbi:hypothetical protein FEM48_Zijuj06G0103000 [Ziziphus jujuba var. spinosa]|uniref:Protein FAM32A-like n=1 Tax=Ziziphus jujuba var. spinosa TaxID=714518 RepID=A0A978V8P8_ZIZJJ|nr:hypothetical protein FEM48_Zijuj06G0103000 [Ziziphus jujuba var. spinosa]